MFVFYRNKQDSSSVAASREQDAARREAARMGILFMLHPSKQLEFLSACPMLRYIYALQTEVHQVSPRKFPSSPYKSLLCLLFSQESQRALDIHSSLPSLSGMRKHFQTSDPSTCNANLMNIQQVLPRLMNYLPIRGASQAQVASSV